jgi:hypothetical protein
MEKFENHQHSRFFDKTTSSGFRCRSRGNTFRAKLTPCGHRRDKHRIYAAEE